eukprot:4243062-Pleurochrysis_carterae.AAC.1
MSLRAFSDASLKTFVRATSSANHDGSPLDSQFCSRIPKFKISAASAFDTSPSVSGYRKDHRAKQVFSKQGRVQPNVKCQMRSASMPGAASLKSPLKTPYGASEAVTKIIASMVHQKSV